MYVYIDRWYRYFNIVHIIIITGCKHFPEQTNEVDKNSVTGSIQTIHAYMENVPYQKKPLYVVHSNG